MTKWYTKFSAENKPHLNLFSGVPEFTRVKKMGRKNDELPDYREIIWTLNQKCNFEFVEQCMAKNVTKMDESVFSKRRSGPSKIQVFEDTQSQKLSVVTSL